MAWLSFLNPMNWIKILGMLSNVFGYIKQAIDAFQVQRSRKASENKVAKNSIKLDEALANEGSTDEDIRKATRDLLNGN